VTWHGFAHALPIDINHLEPTTSAHMSYCSHTDVLCPFHRSFCEKCALEHFRKSNKCFVCATPTGGVFKPAKEILKKKKEEESAENGQAADAGAIEEASDEE
jgi:hypothetical protein